MTLLDADIFYELARRCEARAETVADGVVEQYDRLTATLKQRLGGGPEYGIGILRILRRLRWDLNTIPIPPSAELFGLVPRLAELERLVGPSRQILGQETAALLEQALAALREAERRPSSPLADAVVELLSDDHLSQLLVLHDDRHREVVSQWLHARVGDRRVATLHEIQRTGIVDRMVVVGPYRWYPSPMLLAPRAAEVAFVYHDWLRDVMFATGLLGGASQGVGRSIRTGGLGSAGHVDASDLIPEIDWDRLVTLAVPTSDGPDRVPANLLILAGNVRVFVEAEEGPSIFLVDPDGDRGRRVRRIETRSVSVGDHLLLRKARGGGDFIHEVADRQLGDEARELRSLQREWKAALRDRVTRDGPSRALRDLRTRGMQARNLRYWLSEDSIRTASARDFRILMEYAGLGDRVPQLWRAMARIDDAHRDAGQSIRALLEERVESSDLEELRQRGHLEVNLAGSDSGSLGIYRVFARSPVRSLVPRTLLREPNEIGADDWLG